MITQVFNHKKALNALLYVLAQYKSTDIHKVFKTLYFADLYHLAEYGRSITGDTYYAMKHGPVPTRIYDMIKIVRGDSLYSYEKHKEYANLFSVKGKEIKQLSKPDLEELSESDIEMIDKAVDFCKDKSFTELSRLTHGNAWQRAYEREDNRMQVEDILRDNGEDENFISYIMEDLAVSKALSNASSRFSNI